MDISVRKMTKRDVPFFNEVRNTYAEEFLHDSRTFTFNEAHKWFVTTNPTYQIIYYDKKRAGYVNIENYSNSNKNVKIGVRVDPTHIGTGLNKSVIEMMLSIFFNDYEMHKIVVELMETDELSIELYKLLGFTVDGTKRDEVFKNGQWVNSVIMSILITDYNKIKK